MIRARVLLTALTLVIGVGAGIAVAQATEPLGTAPTFTTRAPSAVANAQAITRQIWIPGLDEGYVPQGLTVAGGAVFVSAYKSEDTQQSSGPCRLYRVDAVTGATTGQLDIPKPCGHAGGIARGSAGRIFVADTHAVFEIAVASPASGSIGTIVRTVKLTGKLKGSFAAGSADAIWLGAYERQGGARLYKVPFAALKGSIDESAATASVPLPDLAQGAAFDRAGRLWITRSGSKFGQLVELDPATGVSKATYAMPIGSEDLSFDGDGGLWTLSEAGSKRWSGWVEHFPFIVRLDVGKLR